MKTKSVVIAHFVRAANPTCITKLYASDLFPDDKSYADETIQTRVEGLARHIAFDARYSVNIRQKDTIWIITISLREKNQRQKPAGSGEQDKGRRLRALGIMLLLAKYHALRPLSDALYPSNRLSQFIFLAKHLDFRPNSPTIDFPGRIDMERGRGADRGKIQISPVDLDAVRRLRAENLKAFDQLRDELLKTDANKFVALVEGKIIDRDTSSRALADRVVKEHHPSSVLIRKVIPAREEPYIVDVDDEGKPGLFDNE